MGREIIQKDDRDGLIQRCSTASRKSRMVSREVKKDWSEIMMDGH